MALFRRGNSAQVAAHPGGESNKMQIYLLSQQRAAGTQGSLCSRNRLGDSRVGFSLQIETQMRTETPAYTFHAEGRGGCGKPDLWPVPWALQETLTVITHVSI